MKELFAYLIGMRPRRSSVSAWNKVRNNEMQRIHHRGVYLLLIHDFDFKKG